MVAGGRHFSDYELTQRKLDSVLQETPGLIVIISGCCDRGTHTFTRKDGTKVYGADGLGEKYAEDRDLEVEYFPANWEKHGRAAGPIRNDKATDHADALVAFWDGKSKGTRGVIILAKIKNLKIRTIIYK